MRGVDRRQAIVDSHFVSFVPFVVAFDKVGDEGRPYVTYATHATNLTFLINPYFYGRTIDVPPSSLNCSHENYDHRTSKHLRLTEASPTSRPINTLLQQGVELTQFNQRFQPFASSRREFRFEISNLESAIPHDLAPYNLFSLLCLSPSVSIRVHPWCKIFSSCGIACLASIPGFKS